MKSVFQNLNKLDRYRRNAKSSPSEEEHRFNRFDIKKSAKSEEEAVLYTKVTEMTLPPVIVPTMKKVKKKQKDKETLDIIQVDRLVQKHFDSEQACIPEYERKITDLEKTLESGVISERMKIDINRQISDYKAEIEKLSSNRSKTFYIIDTAEILKTYRDLLKKPIKLNFMGKNVCDEKEKDELIKKYIKIVNKYYPDNKFTSVIVKNEKMKLGTAVMLCISCGNNKNFAVEDNSYICLNCGDQQEDHLNFTSSYKDVDRVNISTKYSYDRKVHFRDCINQYQGKQNCTIDQKVYDDLEDAFMRHHLLKADTTIRKEERFAKITKEHILMFLKELGYAKQYENVTLIHYNMTGKKPDDISHLEEKLLCDFDIIVDTYDKYFKSKVDRVNFMSAQHVLYQLLQKYKHPCKKEDFVILKTIDRKAFHDSIIGDVFSHLGWYYVSMY